MGTRTCPVSRRKKYCTSTRYSRPPERLPSVRPELLLANSDSLVLMCDKLPARALRSGTMDCGTPGARLLKIQTTGSPGMDTENLPSPSSHTLPWRWPALQLDQSYR